MKPTRLVLIPTLAGQPAPFMIVAPDGGVLERGVLELEAVERPETLRTVAVCPGADVSVRWLDLPAAGGAQLRAAAAWKLRDELAAAPDRVTTAVGPVAAPGRPRLVAVVGQGLLQAWLDYLEALGVRPDAVTPDMLTLAEPEEEDVLRAVTFGENVALRGRDFAATVQPDLVDLVAGPRRVVPVEDPRAVERALAAAALAPVVNLLDATRRDRTASRGWTRAASLAAALIVSPLVLTAAAAARDDMAARRLDAETVAAIAEAAPDLARTPDPAAALRRQAAAAPPPGGVVAATAALFAAVEGVEGVDLDMLSAEPEDGMKATLNHPGWSDMEAVGRRMADAGLAVTETATLEDGGRVVSDIRIGARP